MPDPVNLCLDKDAVNALFRASSLNVAMAKRATVQRENVSNAVIDGYLGGLVLSMGPMAPFGAVGAYFARKALTDCARVDLAIDEALKAEAAAVHQRYCNMFQHYALRGIGFGFLREVCDEGYRAWRCVQDKFQQARSVNDSVVGALSSAYDWTTRVKVAADVGMVVVGAIVPLGFLANSAAGLGYSLACRFANTISEAGSSDFQSYSVKDGMSDGGGVVGNGAQAVADAFAEDARSLQAKKLWMTLEDQAEKQGKRLSEALERVNLGFRTGQLGTPVQRAAARAGLGNPMTSVQAELAKRAAWSVEGAALRKATGAAEAARQAARPPASVNAFESYHNAPTVGTKIGVVASRVGAIAVGLYFLKDEIIEAIKGQTAADDEKFRKAHGLVPRH